jgi:hypothetical protein
MTEQYESYFMTEMLPIPHNRESLARRGDSHFLYQSERRAFDPADLKAVGSAVLTIARNMRLEAAEIEILGVPSFLSRTNTEAQASLRRMLRLLDLDPTAQENSFVFCDWAAPHEDIQAAGSAFVSTVLHTGPYPYWMSMFHTKKCERTLESPLLTSTRILREGDTFVFDPTIAHMSAPVRSHEDQFLVLLQSEVPIRTELELATVLRRYPRTADDCNKDFIARDEEQARSQ